ncbi:MAG: alpha/beta fold hydrolase [Vicinamibacterales bacterium]
MATTHVNGVDLYYETHGAGEPVLLIHGLGSSTRDWAPQIDALATRFTVVAFDVRGHGRSGKPDQRYSVKLFADDTAALIRALGLAPVHVVGISMGGMIAFQLAVDAPGLVRTLVIVNSGPEMQIRTVAQRLMIWSRITTVRLFGMRKMGEVLATRLLPKPEHAGLRTTFVERWAANEPRAYLSSLRALVNWSVLEHLPSISHPVLVMAADQDYTPVALKQAYTAQLPHGELVVIEDARHFMPIERPHEFNEAVLAFLLRHSEPSRPLP